LGVQILDALFGKLNSSGVDAFNVVMGNWNGAMLIVAGLLATYTIIMGVIGTAQDGQMLGKNMSSVWIPIRYCLGTALILPVVHGYCLIQLAVYWLVVQGIGLADITWSAYVSRDNQAQTISAGITRPNARAFVYHSLESLTCQSLLAKVYSTDDAKSIFGNGSSFGMTTDTGTLSNTLKFGDRNHSGGFRTDTCGTITVKNWSMPEAQNGGSFVNSFFKAAEGVSRMKNINAEHQKQVLATLGKLQPYADNLASGKGIDVVAIDSIANEYEEAVRVKAAEEIAQVDSFKNVPENASQNGFITAGSWYLPLASMADMAQRSVADVPVASGPVNFDIYPINDQWAPVQQVLKEVLSKAHDANTASTTLGINHQAVPGESWWSTLKTAVLNGLDVSIVVDKAFFGTANFALQDGENPIMAMKRWGNYLLMAAGSAYVALTALTVTAGNLPGVGDALSLAVVMFVTPVLVAGFLLSYVFPFAPWLIWVGAITGWMLLVVEAIIAAPLWCVMHLTPHGSEQVGTAGNGYRLLLSLLLRPVLMVFGLIAALTMTQIMGDILNRTFAAVFIMSQTDSGLLIKIFGYLVAAPILYGAMMFTFVKNMFSLMTHLPDELLGWIGGGGPQLGKMAEDMGGERSHTYIAAGAVGRGFGQSAESMRNGANGGDGAGKDSLPDTPNQRNLDLKSSAHSMQDSQAKAQQEQQSAGGSFSEQSMKAKEMEQEADQVRIDNQFDNVEDTLGGEDSEAYQSFSENLKSRMESNPDAPVMDNINNAFNRELNRTYGKGTGGNLQEISNKSYSGAEFQKSMAAYKETSAALDNAGFDEKESKLLFSEANRNAKSNYLHDKESMAHKPDGKNLSNYLLPELQNLRERT
jgi:conjugal transfer/type IV secretion protein DotA/TraY